MIDGRDPAALAVLAEDRYRKALESPDERLSRRAARARTYAELTTKLVAESESMTTLLNIVAGVILEAVLEDATLEATRVQAEVAQDRAAFQAGVLAAVERAVRSIKP